MSEEDGFYGQQQLASDDDDGYNSRSFMVQQLINRMNTATLVRVMSVKGTGVSPVGYVDVQPLVNQVTGGGEAVSHTTIHNVPYLRIQGGVNAVICDPQVGDIGFCIFADHDISRVKASHGPSLPGSRRRFDMADAMYIGGWNQTVPTQYILFGGGITQKTPLAQMTGNAIVGGGASGSFTTPTGVVVTVQDGIITNIF